jgi:S-DNA-T family DNA segregation ATPase FtsK/SpoIIIE
MEKSKRIREEITGILAISSGLIISLSLVTYNRWDPSFAIHGSSPDRDVKNLLGIFGSYLSDTLLQIFGITAYIIPIALTVYGIKKLLQREASKEKKRKPVVSVMAVVILILSISSLLTLIFFERSPECPNSTGSALSYGNVQCFAGGTVGFVITRVTIKLFSTTGSYFLFIPLTFVTLMFLVPFSLVDMIKGARKRAVLPSVSIPLKIKIPLVYQAEQRARAVKKSTGDYELPSLEFLRPPLPPKSKPRKEDLLERSEMLEKKLKDFSVEGKVTKVTPGPIVTMFEFEPAPGIKINRILSLSDDLALTLKTTSLRISPLQGKSTLGIEVPNAERETVFLKEILASDEFRKSQSKLTLSLGKNIFGKPVVTDLARMPHLLIAGATGAGKSVGINVMVLSLLYRATPREVKMLMIDPKMLELPLYEGIPHLILPIITAPKDAADSLKKMVLEMERRYKLLAEAGCRNIETYNKIVETGQSGTEDILPYIVIFIDEFADLMLISANEVENSIARLAQMARAAGIHLILATQRPSVDVITGVIKANFSSRISFHVSSKLDSRIILDTYGAEQLLGKGDMLFTTPGKKMVRIHAPFITEEEIKVIVDFIRAQESPEYSLFEDLLSEEIGEPDLEERDEFYIQAKDLILATGQASISYIQRRLKIGYNRAARIMEMMEEDGIVGPPGEAGKPREILRRR